jgi:hypothetical protein
MSAISGKENNVSFALTCEESPQDMHLHGEAERMTCIVFFLSVSVEKRSSEM